MSDHTMVRLCWFLAGFYLAVAIAEVLMGRASRVLLDCGLVAVFIWLAPREEVAR